MEQLERPPEHTPEWAFLDWGVKKNQTAVLEERARIISSNKADFERQLSINLTHETATIGKLRSLIAKDDEILQLQEEIVSASFSQLNNGVITSTQYVTELNGETQARLNKKIHELQLRQAQIHLLTKSGNL